MSDRTKIEWTDATVLASMAKLVILLLTLPFRLIGWAVNLRPARGRA